MKFEMEFGYFGNNKVIIETHDFDIIDIFQKFIEFQEHYGWAVEYDAVAVLDDEFDDEDDTEDEIDGEVADAAAEAANKE